MLLGRTASACAALAIGIAQMYLLLFSWAYLEAHTSLPSWLLTHGVRGFWFFATLRVFDITWNVCLCLPAAYLLLRLRPRNLWLYLALAVIPAFLWQNRVLLSGEPIALGFTAFLPGMLYELLMLPAAVFVLARVKASVTPNNSFKPKPLRGSA